MSDLDDAQRVANARTAPNGVGNIDGVITAGPAHDIIRAGHLARIAGSRARGACDVPVPPKWGRYDAWICIGAIDHEGDHQAAQLGWSTSVLPFDFFTYDRLLTELHLARSREGSQRRELRDWMARHDTVVQRAHTWKQRALHLGSVFAAMKNPPKGRTDVQKAAVHWALTPRRGDDD